MGSDRFSFTKCKNVLKSLCIVISCIRKERKRVRICFGQIRGAAARSQAGGAAAARDASEKDRQRRRSIVIKKIRENETFYS